MNVYDKVTLIECALSIANIDEDIAKEIFVRLYHDKVECNKCPFRQECNKDKMFDCERFIENELFGKE